MSVGAASSSTYRPEIGWATLVSYERALREFTASEPPRLSYEALAGLSAMDVARLPEPHYFLTSDGCELGFRSYGAAATTELVLIHGSGCFGDQLHAMARSVADAGLARAHTLDMRGHGLSGGERGHAVRYPGQIVDDVGEFLAWLKRRRPKSAIVVAGHSAGGGVVLGLSRTAAAELISGYVFLAPFLGIGSPSIRPFFGGWIAVHAGTLRWITLLNLLGIKRFNDASVIDFNMDACLHDPRFVKDWSFNTATSFGPGLWDADAKPIPHAKPVLVMAGDRDECFFADRYPEALQVIAPHAEFRTVGGRGHWNLLIDRDAIDRISAYLASEFPNTIAEAAQQGYKNDAAA